jgi:hypothetical protein
MCYPCPRSMCYLCDRFIPPSSPLPGRERAGVRANTTRPAPCHSERSEESRLPRSPGDPSAPGRRQPPGMGGGASSPPRWGRARERVQSVSPLTSGEGRGEGEASPSLMPPAVHPLSSWERAGVRANTALPAPCHSERSEESRSPHLTLGRLMHNLSESGSNVWISDSRPPEVPSPARVPACGREGQVRGIRTNSASGLRSCLSILHQASGRERAGVMANTTRTAP